MGPAHRPHPTQAPNFTPRVRYRRPHRPAARQRAHAYNTKTAHKADCFLDATRLHLRYHQSSPGLQAPTRPSLAAWPRSSRAAHGTAPGASAEESPSQIKTFGSGILPHQHGLFCDTVWRLQRPAMRRVGAIHQRHHRARASFTLVTLDRLNSAFTIMSEHGRSQHTKSRQILKWFMY